MNNILQFQKSISFLKKTEKEEIYKYIIENGVTIIKGETGMIMNTVSDSFDNPFNLGELLVSEAEVEYKNKRGYGMIQGDNKKSAIILASIDVFIDMEEKDIIIELEKYFKPSYNRFTKNIKNTSKLTMGTKVNFGLMTEG